MVGKKLKVLYLAYYYAPQNTVAAFRVLKFTKYMPENNIIPYIFTSENGLLINTDLNNDIPPEATVIRKPSKLDSNKTYSLPLNSNKNIKVKIKTLLRDVFFSPDKYLWWFMTSLPNLIKLVRKENIDLILATGGPFSSHVCAYFLKKICKIPIVLDFRDPWKENVVCKKQGFIRQFFNSYWERKCVHNADAIISVTNVIVTELKKYKTNAEFLEITNGFDPDDFQAIEYKNEMEEFCFLYTGKFSVNIENYNPYTVIRAFLKFAENIECKNVKLIFIGNTDDKTRKFIDSFNSDCIEYYPPMKKADVIKWQAKANILIHFYYPITHIDAISMKVFEYIGQRKPIISFNVKQGCLYELLDKYKLGKTASSHDVNEMAELFRKAYCKKIAYNKTSLSELEEYNFNNLTKKLAKLLYNIAVAKKEI